jgi:hypothetical protein
MQTLDAFLTPQRVLTTCNILSVHLPTHSASARRFLPFFAPIRARVPNDSREARLLDHRQRRRQLAHSDRAGLFFPSIQVSMTLRLIALSAYCNLTGRIARQCSPAYATYWNKSTNNATKVRHPALARSSVRTDLSGMLFLLLLRSGLAELLKHHTWVGLANAELACIQHRTKLYVCKIRPLAYV